MLLNKIFHRALVLLFDRLIGLPLSRSIIIFVNLLAAALLLIACQQRLPVISPQDAPSPLPNNTLPTNSATLQPSASFEPAAVQCPAGGGGYYDDHIRFWDSVLEFTARGDPIPAGGGMPDHWVYTLINRSPGPCTSGDSEWLRLSSLPKIYLIPAEAYAAANPVAAERIAALRSLLDHWPEKTAEVLPVLPVLAGSPAFQEQLKRVDFPNGSGVRFITQYPSEEQVVRSSEVFYTFQGLTGDNAYYISAILPLYIPQPMVIPTFAPFTPPPPPPTIAPTYLTPPPTRVYPPPGEGTPDTFKGTIVEVPPELQPTETPRAYPIGQPDPRITSLPFTPEPTPTLSPGYEEMFFHSQYRPALEQLDWLARSIWVRTASAAPASVDLSSLPQGCVVEGQQTETNSAHGFCFAAPSGFTPEPSDPSLLTFYGPWRGEGLQHSLARLNIQVEGLLLADTRAEEEHIVEALESYGSEGLSAPRQPLILSGEPAIRFDLPFARVIFAVHRGRLYTLTFERSWVETDLQVTEVVNGAVRVMGGVPPSETPSEEELAQAQADLELLYQAVTASFNFLN